MSYFLTKNIILALFVSSITACGSGEGDPTDSTGDTVPAISVDDIAPIITLQGSSSITVNLGEDFTDAGALANDNVDGDISSDIQVTGTVDTSNAGLYTLTFNVSDTAGNMATSITRSISVLDSSTPVITSPGNITVAAIDSKGISKTEAVISSYLNSVSAVDTVDGTINQIINDAPQIFPMGATVVTFSATDSDNNTGQAQATVTVSDQTAPQIILNGINSMTLNMGETFNDPGATANDNIDGDISNNIQVAGSVDINTNGLYTLTYNVIDAAGNPATQITRSISVQDSSSPVVLAPANIIIDVIDTNGVAATDGTISSFLNSATATDDIDGSLTVTHNAPTLFQPGTTIVTFSATDSANNTGQASATVTLEMLTISADRQAFNTALEQYALNNYSSASSLFNSFLFNFPASGLTDQAQLYIGKSSYWLSQYSEAKTELNVVINKPAALEIVAEAHYWKGKADAALQDYVSARSSYLVVRTSYSTSEYADNATYGIASTYYDEDNFIDAETWYKKVLTDYNLNTKSDNSQYYLAKSIFAQKRFNEARTEFNTLINLYPASTWIDNAQLQIGQTYFDEKNYNTAITELEKVANNYPASSSVGDAAYYIARSKQELGHFNDARTAYLAMISSYPLNSLIDNAQFRIGQSYFDEAEATLDATLYAQAIIELQKVIDDYVNSTSADISQYYILKSYLGDQNKVEAKGAYDLLVANYPTSSFIDNAAYRLASFSYDTAVSATVADTALFTTAIVEFQNVITTTEGSDDISQYYIARSYHRIADITKVTADYETARLEYAKVNITSYPDSVYVDNAEYQIAKSYHDEADYARAITELSSFTINYHSSSWVDDAYYYLGHSYRRQDTPDYAIALTQYNLVFNYPQSVKLDNAQYYIGYTFHLQTDCVQELIEMQKVITNYPTSSYVSSAQIHINDINIGHTCL